MNDHIPRKKLYCLDDFKSPIAEAFRTLRTNIRFLGVNSNIKIILITSSLPGEGKTSITSELAIALAQEGKKTLIIDCDLRKPSLCTRFNVKNSIGLTDILLKEVSYDEVILETFKSNLYILPSGYIPPNPSELLSISKMGELISILKDQYDYIILDSSPVLLVTDAQILSKLADGVILVIRSGKTSQDYVRKAKNLLDHVGANVIGAVLNNKKVKIKNYY